MRKSKLLTTITTLPLVLTTTAPIISLASCGKTKTIYEQLEQTIINEFFEICKIPHSSDQFLYEKPYKSNVLNLSNYLQKRVEQLTGAKVWQDKYANLWFDIPANDESLKDAPIIALQAHMDMVFTYDVNQFEKAPDPLTYIIEPVLETKDGKRIIHTKNYKTSLGADNGMGIATILALISSEDVKHGKLRVIFTNCEENAMQGAMMMVSGHVYDDPSKTPLAPTAAELLDGVKNVLNLDVGCDGSLFVSSSGAIGSHYKLNSTPVDIDPSLTNKFELKLSGFLGGHSAGAARQNCGNPIVAASEILKELGTDNVQIASLETQGSSVYNVVPTTYVVKFATNKTKADIQSAIATIKTKHSDNESEVGKKLYYKDINNATFDINTATFDKGMSISNSNKIITLQTSLFYGKDESAEDEKNYLKTSANVGPSNLILENNILKYHLSSYSRSDKQDKVLAFKQQNKQIAVDNEFDYLCDAQFPPWKEKENNRMFNIVKEGLLHAGVSPEKFRIGRAHGGLECSWWQYIMKQRGQDDGAICLLGVNVADEHKVTETVDVESIQTNLKAVMYCLENANTLK